MKIMKRSRCRPCCGRSACACFQETVYLMGSGTPPPTGRSPFLGEHMSHGLGQSTHSSHPPNATSITQQGRHAAAMRPITTITEASRCSRRRHYSASVPSLISAASYSCGLWLQMSHVAWSVSMLGTWVSPAKTAEPIEICPRNHVV